jgi:hypothetical protein
VVGLHFGEAPSGQTRLFSLGADRRLLEYDLSTADAANAGLRTKAVLDVVAPGGSGQPCSMCFAPPMPYYSANSMDTLLLVAGEHHLVPVERGCVCMCCKDNMMTHPLRRETGMLD